MPYVLKRRVLKTIKWGLIHAALVLFFADLLAAVWPAFQVFWTGSIAHIGVAAAAFMAVVAEYLHEEAQEKRAETVELEEASNDREAA